MVAGRCTCSLIESCRGLRHLRPPQPSRPPIRASRREQGPCSTAVVAVLREIQRPPYGAEHCHHGARRGTGASRRRCLPQIPPPARRPAFDSNHRRRLARGDDGHPAPWRVGLVLANRPWASCSGRAAPPGRLREAQRMVAGHDGRDTKPIKQFRPPRPDLTLNQRARERGEKRARLSGPRGQGGNDGVPANCRSAR